MRLHTREPGASALSNQLMIADYDLDDLLTLVLTDDAERLTLELGEQPVVHWRGEPHPVEGPDISAENTARLLQSIATPLQVQECRERGPTEFIYAFRGSAHFKVRAMMQQEGVRLDLERVLPLVWTS